METALTGIGILIIFILIVVFAFLGGLFFARIKHARREKKIQSDAIKVLKGEKENIIEIDGKKYDARKFKVRDENNKEVVIDFGELEKGDGVQKPPVDKTPASIPTEKENVVDEEEEIIDEESLEIAASPELIDPDDVEKQIEDIEREREKIQKEIEQLKKIKAKKKELEDLEKDIEEKKKLLEEEIEEELEQGPIKKTKKKKSGKKK